MRTSGESVTDQRIGPYRLLRVLGEGGMGVVYLAEGADRDPVAVKLLRQDIVGDEEARQRLAREVATLSRVTTDRVAAVIDADPWGPRPYVVTEFVDGPDLRAWVRDHGPMPERALRVFGAGLAEAVAAVHRVGVLHRDIKPGNVLVEDGEAVLIDFGLARLAEDPRLTSDGSVLGTPGYLAPEVLYGEEATAASDVHSLAATLAFAAIGRPPAGTGPPMAIMDRVRRGEFDLSGVPTSVLPLIEDCLAPDPRDRPSVREILEDLGGRSPAEPTAEPTLVIDRTRALPAEIPPPLIAPAAPIDPYQQVLAPPPMHRGRQRAGVVGLLAATFGLTALAPWIGLILTAALAAVMRFASVTSQRHHRRRALRGRARWYDVPASAVASPFYLLFSLAGTLVLLCAGACVVGCAALALGAAHVRPAVSLTVLAALWVVVLWWGPGSQRVRECSRRSTRFLAAPTRLGPMLLLGGCAVGLVLILTLFAHGAFWAPAGGAPWEHGWMSELARWMR
ncbi:MAG TPA: serine/threonine-protein kinase [Marmoricola sp.]